MTVLAAQASGSPTTVPPVTRTVATVAAPGPRVTRRGSTEPSAAAAGSSAHPTPATRPPSDEVADWPGTVSAVAAARTHSDPGDQHGEL